MDRGKSWEPAHCLELKMQKILLVLWRVPAWTEYLEECHSGAVWVRRDKGHPWVTHGSHRAPTRQHRTPCGAGTVLPWVTRFYGGCCKNPCITGLHRTRRSEEHTSELQSLAYLVCRLLLEKKKKKIKDSISNTKKKKKQKKKK